MTATADDMYSYHYMIVDDDLDTSVFAMMPITMHDLYGLITINGPIADDAYGRVFVFSSVGVPL